MPDLTDYVRKQRQSGFSDEQIKTALLNAGWPQKTIDQALAGLKPKKIKASYIIVGVIVLLVIIFSMLFIFLGPKIQQQIEDLKGLNSPPRLPALSNGSAADSGDEAGGPPKLPLFNLS